MPLCDPGLEWSWAENKCVPIGTRLNAALESRRTKGLWTPVANMWDKKANAGVDTPWADKLGYNPQWKSEQGEGLYDDEGKLITDQTTIDSPADWTGNEDVDKTIDEQGLTTKEPEQETVVPKDSIMSETPGSLYTSWDALSTQLAGLLSTTGQQEAEDRYWDTKQKRLEEDYIKRKDQLEQDLNVKGLYYSGIKGDKLEELNDNYMQIVAEEESKFQYERFQRDLERNNQTINYVLGSKAQEIQWALGRGQLTLQQIDLALQESLGIRTLELKDKGLLQDFMTNLAYTSIANARTDIERQTAWTNMVQILYQMGLSEQEINSIWAGISGQATQPPV